MALIKITAQKEPHVALIELNRPSQLNALNPPLMEELLSALKQCDKDSQVHVIIITGNEKAFAAGADIKQMANKSAIDMLLLDQFDALDQISNIKKPIIAAVSGFALGGGCELAMLCDIIIASETAKFGQPEIKLGVIPGAGGTQRLTRAVGKVKAMEMILSGELISAEEANRYGLVNKVVSIDNYLKEALRLAGKIARMSPLVTRLGKEAINNTFETHLKEGIAFERKSFYLTFGSNDQKEGMNAFIEKQQPKFTGT